MMGFANCPVRLGKYWLPGWRIIFFGMPNSAFRLRYGAGMPADSAEHVVVLTTVDSEAAARTIATSAIEARLAACAQVVGPITSVFRWEGEVQTATEWRIECKAPADRSGALEEFLNLRHPYDLPEVVVMPITGGSPRYLSWLVSETR